MLPAVAFCSIAGGTSLLVLLVLAEDVGLAVAVDVDVEPHRVAADGAVLDVVLMLPARDVDRHDDLLATGIADIGRFEFDCRMMQQTPLSTWDRHGFSPQEISGSSAPESIVRPACDDSPPPTRQQPRPQPWVARIPPAKPVPVTYDRNSKPSFLERIVTMLRRSCISSRFGIGLVPGPLSRVGAALLLAQCSAWAQPSQPTPTRSPAAAASAGEDAARKETFLASERWRRAMFEFDQWLAHQPVYTPAQVRKIKSDLTGRVDSMSSFELEYLLDTLETKLAVLKTPQAEDARSWLGQYLSVMADRKRAEVLGTVPNILDMSSTELEAALRQVEEKRTAVEQHARRSQQTRGETAELVEANRLQQEEDRTALAATRAAPDVYSPYRGTSVPDPPFAGSYDSPTVVGVGPWGSFLLIPTVAF
jgi:hypothetical protein